MGRHTVIAGLALALLAGPVGFVQTATAQEAAVAPAGAVAMKVVVESVSGVASKRLASDPNGKWERIKAQDVLDVLTIVRTGLGGKVVLRFGDRGRVTVDAGTKVGIREYLTQGELMKAQLGLKYGSVRASVDSKVGKNDFRVATPVATLSIRGTDGRAHFGGAFGLNMRGTIGIWHVAADGKGRNVYAGEGTNGQLTRSAILAMLADDTRMGDPFGGLTAEEIMNLIQNGGGRGIFNFVGSRRGSRRLFLSDHASNGHIIPSPEGDGDGYPYDWTETAK